MTPVKVIFMVFKTHFQRTIKESISFVGLGLHSGIKSRITLSPCENELGIYFKLKGCDSPENIIEARWYNVTNTTLSTVLSNQYGISISTVEHLMAALRICQIDNLEIEVDGPEIPIMDGSAKPFLDTLSKIGTKNTKIPTNSVAILINKPIEVHCGEQYALFIPDNEQRITVSINFKENIIGAQTHSVVMNDASLHQDIAPARTFGFLEQVEALRKKGYVLGGSLKNAIVVNNDKIVNKEGLRFSNEFVRHKILDTIGDLSLIGVPIIGHYHSYKGGHLINNLLIKKLFEETSAWSYIPLEEHKYLYGQYVIASNNESVNIEYNYHDYFQKQKTR